MNRIINTISENAVNDGVFSVANRTMQAHIDREIGHQQSGRVSNETMASISRQMGASLVIVVELEQIGGRYDFRLIAIDIETALERGRRTFRIHNSPFIQTLLTGRTITPDATFSFNAFGGVTLSNVTNGESLGTTVGGTGGVSMIFLPESIFSIEPGVMWTQRGFDEPNYRSMAIEYFDFMLKGNLSLLGKNERSVFPYLYAGISYALHSEDLFKDDVLVLLGTGIRFGSNRPKFGVQAGWDFGTQEVYRDYKNSTGRVMLNVVY
jgi:hypothetical protein